MPNTTAVRTAQVGAAPFFAGKNAIINGDFGVWQRGTSFTNLNGAYAADRFRIDTSGTATTMTTTQQTFTPGTAPVSGYEGVYYFRNTITTVGTMTSCDVAQYVENVQTFAGQTVTISFWAKADSARTLTGYVAQIFGSGGSSAVDVNPSGNSFSLTTSWQRFSYTISMPSISGKTIGTSSYLIIKFRQAVAAGSVFDFWGLQMEAGSTATAFQTATGTIQGELAACQRYYYRITDPSGANAYTAVTVMHDTSANGTTTGNTIVTHPVTMRTAATSLDYANIAFHRSDGTLFPITAVTIDTATDSVYGAMYGLTLTGSGLASGNVGRVIGNNNLTNYFGVSAEL